MLSIFTTKIITVRVNISYAGGSAFVMDLEEVLKAEQYFSEKEEVCWRHSVPEEFLKYVPAFTLL